MVWGVAIAGTIFNQYINKYTGTIQDDHVQQLFKDGNAFALATKEFVNSYQDPVRAQIQNVWTLAYRRILQIGIIWVGIGLVAALLTKDIKMRTGLETEFGFEEQKKKETAEPEMVVSA